MKLTEIADRIDKHLKRFERDFSINKNTKPDRSGCSTYYNAGAFAGRTRVKVVYVSYQGQANMKKADAVKYLAWLDAGGIGTHYKAGIQL